MAGIIAANAQILSQLNAARALLNGPQSLRLFINDFSPTPASLASDFAEASFAGYARKNTAGNFAVPIKVADGLYQSTSADFVWSITGGETQIIYGWFLIVSLTVRYSKRFDNPTTITVGSPLTVQIGLQEASLANTGP